MHLLIDLVYRMFSRPAGVCGCYIAYRASACWSILLAIKWQKINHAGLSAAVEERDIRVSPHKNLNYEFEEI
jgi:hypothetical protein